MNKFERTMKSFENRSIDSRFFTDRKQLVEAILEEIPQKATVAIGGSKTIETLGVYEYLTERGSKVLWHWKTEEEKISETLKQALLSDVYLSSSNAITEDGRIINIDGNGNRVAAMFFGPKKVILVAGGNKICPDMDSAIKRIKEVACPKNAERLNRKVPCRYTGKCSDCRSPHRMCMVTSVIEIKPPMMDFKVFLIDEELGC